MSNTSSMRTPLSKVRGLGSAKSGTEHFWNQRVTSVALVPLTIIFVFIVVGLIGRNHAAAAQILGSPFVAITIILAHFERTRGMAVLLSAKGDITES